MRQTDMDNVTETIPLRTRLEQFGDPRHLPDWRSGQIDYVARLGLAAEHIPELVAIAREWADPVDPDEPEDDVSIFAPVHAWRSLAQLKAPEAIDPLLEIMEPLDARTDDWYLDEFPDVLAQIGLASFEPARNYLVDGGRLDYPRIAAARTLRKLATRYPETRDDAVKALCEALANFQNETDVFNALLINLLLDLKATEAAELIQRAFAADCVDVVIEGNWNYAREKLGVEGLGLVPKHLAEKRGFSFFAPSPPGEDEELPVDDPADVQASRDDPHMTIRSGPKVGRNDPCPCGSGKKYKKCCGR